MKLMPRRVILYFFFFICIYHAFHLKVGSAITEQSLAEVGANVFTASKMLEYASLSLRSAYVTADSSVSSFVDLRRSVTNEAKVYSIKILPIATALIQRLQEFSENYDAIPFDEFKEYLHELTNKAEENYMFSKYVLELHKAILTEFKMLKDGKANKVLKELEMEAKHYEEKLDKLRREASVKDDLAIGLAFIPIINLIVVPIIVREREEIIAQTIAISEEKTLAVAAARAIQGPLLKSIDEFIIAISGITQFFGVLHRELESFSGRHKSSESEQLLKMHFKVIKKKATTLVSACRFFMSKIPEFETNLMAIPNDHNQNYVQGWFLKKQAEIDGEKKTFIEWGKKWFGSNKNIANILGLPSSTIDRSEL